MVSWFSLTEIFQASDTEIHLYTGSTNHPRSQLTIFTPNEIRSAFRVPSINIDSLKKRYYRKNLKLGKFSFNIKMILISLLDRDKFPEVPTFKDIISEAEESEYIQLRDIDTYDEDEYKFVLDERIETIDGDGTAFKYFFKIITQPSVQSRQHALTQLIAEKSELAKLFTYWLLGIRGEVTASVIRELGRHRIEDGYVLNLCEKKYRYSDDPGIERYAFWYLFSNTPHVLKKDRELLNLKYHANQFQELSKLSIWRRIKAKYKQEKPDNSQALQGLALLSELSHDRPFEIVKLHYQYLPLDKSLGRVLRRAIMPLLKQVEITHDVVLLVSLSLLSLLGRSYVVEENRVVEHVGPFGFDMKYVHRRISALLKLWKMTGMEKEVHQVYNLIISHYPPGNLKHEDMTAPKDVFNKWVARHPIFGNLVGEPNEIFNDVSRIKNMLIHLGQFRNWIILSQLNKRLIAKNIGNLSFDSAFNGYVVSRLNFIKSTDIVVEPNSLLSDPEIKHRDDDFLGDLIAFAIEKELIVEEKLIQELVDRSFQEHRIETELILIYLNAKKDNRAVIERPLEILFDKIGQYYEEKKQNQSIESFIISHIVNLKSWVRVIPQKFSYNIDAIKIIYKDELDDFDLENWQPLDIETIAIVYKYTHGEIPSFIEGTVNYAFSKPDWDQLARHYIAMGIQRPNRNALAKSQLKRVPSQLTRDILGQISLVNQAIAYCERNGFTETFENLIIQNIYRRGWNIERRLERTIASLFGSISPRLRSYFAAYLVTEQGELNEDILELARDVENHQIRDKIIRSLERYATIPVWFTLAESYHPDLREQALRQIKDSRMSNHERSKIIIELVNASRPELQELGRRWLKQYGLMEEDMVALFYNPYLDCWEDILEYIDQNRAHYTEEYDTLIANLISRILWHPDSKSRVRQKAVDLIGIINQEKIKNELKDLLANLSLVSIQSRAGAAIEAYTNLEEVT